MISYTIKSHFGKEKNPEAPRTKSRLGQGARPNHSYLLSLLGFMPQPNLLAHIEHNKDQTQRHGEKIKHKEHE